MVTYKTLAGYDLEASKKLLDAGSPNLYTTAALLSSQAVEKSLKFVIAKSVNHPEMKIEMSEIVELMKTHNIKKLMYVCLDVFTDIYRLKRDILDISEVFYKSRYPGEFEMLTEEKAKAHYMTAIEVYKCCDVVLKGGRY